MAAEKDEEEKGGRKNTKRKSTGSAKAKPAGKANAKSKARKAAADLEKAIEGAEKFLGSLRELQVHTLWKSCIRASEIDRRLSRESSVVSNLDSSMSVDQCPEDLRQKAQNLMNDIQQEAKTVLNLKEFCKELRSCQDLTKQVNSEGGTLCELLSADNFAVGKRVTADMATLADMLTFAAKKIIEVPWLS